MRSGALGAVLGILMALGAGCAETDDGATDEAEDALTRRHTPEQPVPADFAVPPEYADGLRHSRMTPAIVSRLKGILASGRGASDRVSKIGDSMTFSPSFLRCLAGRPTPGHLEETRAFFDHGSFERTSLSATVGWQSYKALDGSPAPVDRELSELDPAFAIVMYGTNETYEGGLKAFEANLTTLIERVLARGVVPIMSTIPARQDPRFDALVPGMNRVVRRVAAFKGVPLMDFWAATHGLPKRGLSSDGVHPSQSPSGACALTESALGYGYNQRNLLALEALDRVRRFVVLGERAEAP